MGLKKNGLSKKQEDTTLSLSPLAVRERVVVCTSLRVGH